MINRILRWTIGIVVVAGIGFVLGYLPEHLERQGLAGYANSVAQVRDSLDAELRLYRLLDDLLVVTHEVSTQNYGLAREHSTKFFNEAARLAGESENPQHKEMLSEILAQRDTVTTALALADPSVEKTLLEMRESLRSALGRQALRGPVPPGTAAAAAPAEERPSPSPSAAPPSPADSPGPASSAPPDPAH